MKGTIKTPVKALPQDTEMKEQKQDQTQEIEPEASKQRPRSNTGNKTRDTTTSPTKK